MKPDTRFVGVRKDSHTAIWLENGGRCVPLPDYLAHLQDCNGFRFEWAEHSGASLLTAIAILTAVSGRKGLSGQIAEDFQCDVVNQLDRDGWELSVATVQQYIELWVTCRARQNAKQQPCYGCGDG